MAITLHADGRILNSAGINIAAAPMVDMWRLNTDHTIATSANSYITSNWERVDTDSFQVIGSGMSESSGIFTFPDTGIWYVTWDVTNFHNGSSRELQTRIAMTTNNSSYANVVENGSIQYKDESIMNGGSFMDNIVGFDNDSSMYAPLN